MRCRWRVLILLRRTGCNNCKGRRVKCDETRPQCIKCVRSGRVCEGYPAYKRSSNDPVIVIAPKPQLLAATSANSSPPSTSSATAPSSRSSICTNARRPTASSISQTSRPTPPPTPQMLRSPVVRINPRLYEPQDLGFNSDEGQYFQVFRLHTANELSGFFDSDFWMRSVLQESHAQASIRHAVVALGALYKTLEKAAESPPSSPSDAHQQYDAAPKHYNFALQQYAKSVTRLREAMQNNEARSRRTILISIVLFTCFQSFTGDHKSAIFQIQHGLSLLEERRQDSYQPLTRRREDPVEDELVQMFTRLAIQAKSYDMAFHFPHPYVIRLTPQPQNPTSPQSPSSPSDTGSSIADSGPPIPNIFNTSQEARTSLDSLQERIMRFNEALSSHYAGPNNILPASIKSMGLGFRTQLAQWTAAFEPLVISRRSPGVTNTERASVIVLKMMSLMTTILFMMGFSTSEMDFDNFTPQFKEIVDLANELVVDEELSLASKRCGNEANCRHNARHPQTHTALQFPGFAAHEAGFSHTMENFTHIKASFALDLGIVPPLFVVATKCRDRKLRRDAIRLLLSSPRREGMWDSILSGKVAEWIMYIEEEGMQPFALWGPALVEIVRDEKRVMVKEILFDLQAREATLRCGTRGARDGDRDLRAKETFIHW